MYSYGFDAAFYVILVFLWIISLVITFFIIRYAVRANEQISILKAISEKQNTQIDLLLSAIHKDDK